MSTAWRIFKNSWMHLARNLWIGLATVFVLSTALLSVDVLLGANVMLSQASELMQRRVDVTVTFQPKTPDPILGEAKFYLASLPQTEEVKLVTAEEALKAFRERNKDNPRVTEALNELSENPMGAQLIIKAKRVDDYPFLIEAAQNPQYRPFIKSSSYNDQEAFVRRIQVIARNIQLTGAAMVALFSLFGLLTAFNAIRVAIYTHRDEIAIMRLVGASSIYIRGPFVLEGIWIALLSLVISIGFVITAVQAVEPRIAPLFGETNPGLSTFFIGQWPIVFGLQILVLLVLTIFVSWIAAGRYIRR